MDVVLTRFNEWFWNHNFWLPQGYTWEDLEVNDGITRPQLSDLYITPFLTILLLCFRYFFERYIALYFCTKIGIKNRIIDLPVNEICNQVYNYETKKPDTFKVKEIAAQTGWTTYQVTKWFRRKRNINKLSLMRKATETCWRVLVYFTFFVLGSYVMFTSDWFGDMNTWVVGYIHKQPLTTGIKWYYLMELSFYMSLLVSQFFDAKRKDFFQLFIHHIATIILIGGSYIIAHFHYGAVIIYLHDASDYWLESAKIANYAKTQKLCDALFVVFAVTFFICRWIYFPFWVLRGFIFHNPALSGMHSYFDFPYLFVYLCFVLLVLHIYWGYLIANMVYKFTVAGKVEKDDRSNDEDSDDATD